MAATTTPTPKPIYKIGQTVYHRMNDEAKGIITGITIRPGWFTYQVTWGSLEESPHYELELSDERGFSTEGGGIGEN